MTTDLLANLNPQQREAVTAGAGPVLVLAGPGSGKTGVLTRRVAFLVREMDIRPWHIMAVTFTNKAASEMRHRVESYLGADGIQGFQIGTFHSTCARILRQEHEYTPYKRDFVIYDTDDQLNVIGRAMNDLDLDTKRNSPRSVLGEISRAKNEFILPQQYIGGDYFTEIVSRVYPMYQRRLLASNALDFDDLLVQMVVALRESEMLRTKYQQRYSFVLVDEFQDTNSVQYQLVKLFGAPQNNLFIVGDEDQSIYAFRGADYRNVLRVRKDFPEMKVILLEQNYRSTQYILDAARAVIDKNPNRTVKALFTDKPGGERITVYEAYDDEAEARYIAEQIELLRMMKRYKYSDFAVIYRTNGQSRALEDRLIKQSLPYNIVGDVSFYKRREIRDVLAYLRMVNNPNDRVSFERVINVPKRGIGEKSMSDFFLWLERDALTIEDGLRHLMNGGMSPLSPRVVRPMTEFALQLDAWRSDATDGNLLNTLDAVLADIRYRFYLRETSADVIEAQNREDNIEVLRAAVKRADEEAKPLADFITESSLMQDAAETRDTTSERVTMMTLHAAKGLEYPVVFITGLEDGILPHFRSKEEEGGLEEERRLFYVGITRAKERLFITYAFRRMLYANATQQEISKFLLDIPKELLDHPPATLGADGSVHRFGAQTRWEAGSSANGFGIGRLQNDLVKQSERNAQLSGKVVKLPVPSKPTTHKTGMKVFHEKFGQGTVIESKWQDGDEIVTVAFEKPVGIKILSLAYAKLTILN